MTEDNITEFPAPEATETPKQPQLPDELRDKLAEAYESITAHGQAILNEAGQLAQEFGTPEVLATPTFQDFQKHLDLALGFYAHRLVAMVVPTIWARHATQKDS